MKVAFLAAGAGEMYCGSCLHSNTLAGALRTLGVDVVLAPLYTPLRTDEDNVSLDRLALGGINVYLQDRSPLFRRMPRFIDRLLDWPALVRWVARRGSRTRPEELGSLTVSVLRAEEGPVRKEVDRLVEWLRDDLRPDVVHLSNVMLAGLARPLKAALGVPVVSSLAGEDAFLERLPQPSYDRARAVLRERAADLAGLVAMNRYYAEFMAEYLAVPRQRIHVVRPGLNLMGHRPPTEPADDAGSPSEAEPTERVVGYLGRICPDKGVHLLVEAMALLADDRQLPPFRIRMAGYLDPADRSYLAELRHRADVLHLGSRLEYLGELDREGKIAFLQGLDLLAAPSLLPESKGLPVIEAWANGVPVVAAGHGAFCELVEHTGGGLLFEPGSPAALAAALRRMLCDRPLARECGRRAHAIVHEEYRADRMAKEVLEVYEAVCS